MRKLLRLSAVSAAALAIALAPLPGPVSLGNWVGATGVYAGPGNSGNHGNSGGSGNSGSSHAGGNNSSNSNDGAQGNAKGGNSDHGNIASLAGFGNAAHASVQGLLRANPHSAVGRLKVYADLHFSLTALQTAVGTAQTAVNTDALAIQAYNDAVTAGGTSPTKEQQATIDTLKPAFDAATSALPNDQLTLDTAKAKLATATDNADAAFALATRNPNAPGVKTYIDGLLTKYYAYLGQP